MNFNFPKLPKSKIYNAETEITPEQFALMKLLNSESINELETEDIEEAIKFYKECFPYLQSIPLSNLTELDTDELRKFLHEAINFHINIENDITFSFLFRVTKVKEEFLENAKLRNPEYIIFPNLELVKALGLYNRASSPNATVFYASFFENVALHETRPQVGDRIIITTWKNVTQKKFTVFPIANNETVKNKMLEHSTAAVKMLGQRANPLLFGVLDLYLLFLSSEFVKSENINSAKRYEYFFSAYFGDMILNKNQVTSDKYKPKINKGKKMGDFDAILYPSVAFNHKEENLAVSPDSMLKNLHPIHVEDCIVEETYYDKVMDKDVSPIKKRILRTVTNITDNKFIWSDDFVVEKKLKTTVK